jgi:sialate O-acetylesterase
MIYRFFTSLVALFLLSSNLLPAQFSLSGYFGDRMVLQRQQPILVWGAAPPGTEVSVALSDQKTTAKADDKGQWKAELKAMEASGPFELNVSDGSNTRSVKDVMIGDVWLIAGQSNVVLPLSSDKADWPALKASPINNDIRVCKLPGRAALEPADQYSRAVVWDVLNTAKVGGYLSGVGYHFVRTIQPAVGVTVGLVEGAAGGTQIEQWTPEASLKAADPENKQFDMREKARAKVAADPTAKVGEMEGGAASMYNGTIYPMRYAKWKGVVWYQGEANSRTKADYRMLLKNFVESWRQVFGEPDLPFVIVQLPNFGIPKDDGWMRLQEAQMLAARDMDLPLVVTIDQGSKVTIHPPNKAEVGRRAGLAALQHVYKQDVDGTSPLPKSVTYEGDSATVEFDGFKGNLVLKGDAVQGFELAGADGNFQPTTAKIDGRRVVVTAAGVPQPKTIRYLWANSPEAVTLYSTAGLPAAPFRSEGLPSGDSSPALQAKVAPTPASP